MQVSISVIIFYFKQLLADLQAAASLVNKQKLSSTNDHTKHELISNSQTNKINNNDNNMPHITQAKRRATHNAVERRRRDRINQHIQQLSKLIPDCNNYVKSQVKYSFKLK